MRKEPVLMETELDWQQHLCAEEGETYIANSNLHFRQTPSSRCWRLVKSRNENGKDCWVDRSDPGLAFQGLRPWHTLSRAMSDIQAMENMLLSRWAEDHDFDLN